MRRAFTGLLLILLMAPTASAQSVRIIVTVIGEELGEEYPLAGAVVMLSAGFDRFDERSRRLEVVTTDASGTKVFVVPPGDYTVRAAADGFANFGDGLPDQDVYDRRELSVRFGDYNVSFRLWRRDQPEVRESPDAGSAVEDASLPAPVTTGPKTRPRPGLLRGVVMTADGRTLAGAQVTVAEARVGGSHVAQVVTNADGTYQAVVAPGEYRVLASLHMPPREWPPVWETYGEGAGAAPIFHVHPGRVLANADVRLRATRWYRVRVVARGLEGGVPSDLEIEYYASGLTGLAALDQAPSAEGTVTFAVTEGPVLVVARSRRTALAGMVRLQVTAPEDEVRMTLTPGGRIVGKVEFKGLQRPPNGGIRVTMNPAGRVRAGSVSVDDPEGLTDADGRFVFDGMLGNQCFMVGGSPEGWRLDSVTIGGVDTEWRPVSIEPGDLIADVVLTLAPGVGELRWPPRDETACPRP
jgi:hypothetical protein